MPNSINNRVRYTRQAKAFFDSLGLDKLPTIKELREEYSVLSQEKLVVIE